MSKSDAEWYTVQCTDGKFFTGKDGKADSIKLSVRVVAEPGTGREFEPWLSLGAKSIEYSMQALRCLGWTCNDVTVLTGIGSIKARMGIKRVPKTNAPGDGFFTNYSFWPLKEPKDNESNKEFAKKYFDSAKSAEKVTATAYNIASNLPPAVIANTGGASDEGPGF